ncbi:MAG TPA: hypothetical protein VLA36_05565 [Longimicrobiales bacterium]|nr:hypothetical protein [Longimicrobiales bacterium]
MIRRISTSAVITTALGGLLLAAGCATATAQKDSNPFSQDLADRNEVRIQVMNFNFSDATVWALVRDGRRTRLGYVTGKTEAVFTMPWTMPEPLRLEFDLLAGVRCITEQIVVDPGDILELQISVDPSSDPQCR